MEIRIYSCDFCTGTPAVRLSFGNVMPGDEPAIGYSDVCLNCIPNRLQEGMYELEVQDRRKVWRSFIGKK